MKENFKTAEQMPLASSVKAHRMAEASGSLGAMYLRPSSEILLM